MNNPVDWFELPVLDLERAKGFYERVFGFEMKTHQSNAEYEMVWFP